MTRHPVESWRQVHQALLCSLQHLLENLGYILIVRPCLQVLLGDLELECQRQLGLDLEGSLSLGGSRHKRLCRRLGRLFLDFRFIVSDIRWLDLLGNGWFDLVLLLE